MKLPRLLSENKGYTLTEVMIVVSLIAIMSSVGYSGFSSMHKRHKVRSTAYEFGGYLKEIRMKAVEKCCSYFIDFSGVQYTIYMDADGDNTLDPDIDVVFREVDLAKVDPDITVETDGFPMSFNSKGMPALGGGGFGNGSVIYRNDAIGFNVTVTIARLGRVTIAESSEQF